MLPRTQTQRQTNTNIQTQTQTQAQTQTLTQTQAQTQAAAICCVATIKNPIQNLREVRGRGRGGERKRKRTRRGCLKSHASRVTSHASRVKAVAVAEMWLWLYLRSSSDKTLQLPPRPEIAIEAEAGTHLGAGWSRRGLENYHCTCTDCSSTVLLDYNTRTVFAKRARFPPSHRPEADEPLPQMHTQTTHLLFTTCFDLAHSSLFPRLSFPALHSRAHSQPQVLACAPKSVLTHGITSSLQDPAAGPRHLPSRYQFHT